MISSNEFAIIDQCSTGSQNIVGCDYYCYYKITFAYLPLRPASIVMIEQELKYTKSPYIKKLNRIKFYSRHIYNLRIVQVYILSLGSLFLFFVLKDKEKKGGFCFFLASYVCR